MRSLPAPADGFTTAARALPDSPALEMELYDDQRAALECSAEIDEAFGYGVPPTDAELDAMYAHDLARRTVADAFVDGLRIARGMPIDPAA